MNTLVLFVLSLAIIYGLFNLLFPSRFLTHKKRGIGEALLRAKDEKRSFGVQTVTTCGVIIALIYSNMNYQLSRQEFITRNRPWLRVELALLKSGEYFDITAGDTGSQFRFAFGYKIVNVGPIPAYHVALSKAVGFGEVTNVFEPGEQELIIFPNDALKLEERFKFSGITRESLDKKIAEEGIVVEVRLDYQGIVKTRNNYYSSYRLRYPAQGEPNVVWIKADPVD